MMFTITVPSSKSANNIIVSWFILSVVALAFSGIYSFFPYALRTPAISGLLNLESLFSISLMIHVNLGVLVWFLSITAMLMMLVIDSRYNYIAKIAFYSASVGTLLIIISPFIGEGEPVKNNYIPIYHNFVFILGLGLFFSAIMIETLLTLLSYKNIKGNIINFYIYVSAVIFLIAVLCFIKTALLLDHLTLERSFNILEFYELLFWGAGHILQFNYVQLIIIVWIYLVGITCKNIYFANKKFFFYLQLLNLTIVLICLLAYYIYPMDSDELYQFFTIHMKHFGGLVVGIIGIWSAYNLYKNNIQNYPVEFTTFLSSLFLFLSGGIIGYLISGSNVTVPAHYHGVILGITVGLMGFFYLLLPKLGYQEVNQKLAVWQMIIYTTGQFIHITALAISGGYGVLRKAPGVELGMKAKMFMGAMGIGGTIALIGGVMFVILIVKNIKKG